MKLVLTNKLSAFVPLYSDDGLTVKLEPEVPYALDSAETLVAYIGDKPSVLENIKEGLEVAFEAIRNLIKAWLGQPKGTVEAPDAILVEVQNLGLTEVRVILGDGVTDEHVAPGATYLAKSQGYVELRELGHAPQQGGTPD